MKKKVSDLKTTDQKAKSYRRIVKEIQQLIKKGELLPGDQLLPERQLAEKLEVSRPTLREALSALEAMGLLEITPRGVYVKTDVEALIEPLALMLLQERESMEHLLEFRKIMEVQIVKLAAERATESDLFRIREDAYQHQREIEEGKTSDDADANFHLHVIEAAHNKIISKIMGMISEMLREPYGPLRRKLLEDPSVAKTFLQQHIDIYEAIKDNDPKRAAKIMAEHFKLIEKELNKNNTFE